MAFIYTGAGVEARRAPQLPPEGDYYVQIIAGEEKISQSGKNMIMLTCKIMHDKFHNEIRDFIVEGDGAQQKIFDIFDACGFVPTLGMSVLPGTFIGKRGQVRIKHHTYDGQTYPKIAFWRNRNGQQEPAAPVTPAPAPAQAPDLINDPDEIPF
jgi:hypothetical protein